MDKIINHLKQNKNEYIIAALIFILAVALRLICINNFGALWYDELFSWYFAKQNSFLGTIKYAVNQDVHMPLYFVLLHFWIKLFGDEANAMRYLSFVLSLPLIPITYIVARNLFNKTTACFAAAYLAINTFCIFYCCEVRMYCLNLILAPLIAFAFCKMTDTFEKKYIVLYIVSLSLLFYNFPITPLIAFSYFLVGLIYLLITKREYIIKFLAVNFIISLICILPLYWCVKNAINMHQAIAYFPVDNYPFNWKILYAMLENFFTPINEQLLLGYVNSHSDLIARILFPHYFVYAFLPILIAIFGIIRALFSKNKNFYLFFLPSLVFLVIATVLAATKQSPLLIRYLTIILPVFICAFCFGFALVKNKIVKFLLFIMFIYFNAAGMIFNEASVLSMHMKEFESISNLMLYSAKIKNDDYILNPVSGDLIFYYVKKGKYIPIFAEKAILLKDKESGKMYFGDKFDELTRDNVRDYLIKEVLEDVPHKEYEDKLYNDYIKDMKKGQKVVFISFWGEQVIPLYMRGLSENNYKSYNLLDFIYSKIARDSIIILNKYLHYVNRYEMTDGGYAVYVFEKE